MSSNISGSSETLSNHPVVGRDEWTAARIALLQKEKQLTRLNAELAEERRRLPWVKVDKNYIFDTPQGPRSLSDLFDGRSQLFVKHFMFSPNWTEGCTGCSFESDHLEGAVQHLHHHDVTVVVVSRAPLEKLQAFKKRMGWHFNWVSSAGNDFNFDYHVSFPPEDVAAGEVYYNYGKEASSIDELSGMSVFYKDEAGQVYHTYSTYGRGAEYLIGSYVVLDMTPKGRNETGPNHNLTDWVRHHDKYDVNGQVDFVGQSRTLDSGDSGCGCSSEESET